MAKQEENAAETPALEINVEDITALFTGFVRDITDERFQQEVASLADDAAAIALLRSRGADQRLIDRADEALRGRAQAMVKIPALVAQGRQQAFLAQVSNVANALIAHGFAILRAYAGLPSVPATD